MIRSVRRESIPEPVTQRQARADRRGGSAFRDLFGKGIMGPQTQASTTKAAPVSRRATVTTAPVAAAKTYATTVSETATSSATTDGKTAPAASQSSPATNSAASTPYRSPFQPVSSAEAAPPAANPRATQADGYDPTHVPTVEEVFGESPFVADPRGVFTDYYTGESRSYGFRNMYFASDAAAAKIAAQLGGTVVQRNAILGGGFFAQAQQNNMIQLPNGREINAGFIAHAYTHGYPQSYIDRIIAQEIDPDGGYENLNVPVNLVKNGSVQNWALSKTYSTSTTDA